MLRTYQTPTGIASYKYCERLGYINNIFPFSGGKKTQNTVIGLFEHDILAKFADITKIDWNNSDGITEHELDLNNDRIATVSEFAITISRQNHPEFLDVLKNDLDSLKIRLSLLNKRRVLQVLGLLHKGLTMSEVTDIILPWKIEHWFSSKKYNIRGRADAIYKTVDGGLVVEDIKSHNSRLDAFMHKDEHKIQMVTYAILAEEEFGMPVKSARIFYSRDLNIEHFDISHKDKFEVIKIKKKAEKTLESGLPPRLEGDEAIKCQFCYRKKFCFSLDQRTDDEILDQPDQVTEEWKKSWR